MDVYVYRDGEKLGPYNHMDIAAGLASGAFLPTDMVWRLGLRDWTPLHSLTARAYNPCPQCKGDLIIQSENPQRGTGIIVIVLGALFSPLCVGIPFLIWGLMLISESRSHWHCRGCGRIFPT